MDSSVILIKTQKGMVEITQRSGMLSQKQRSMLIMVDGKTPTSALVSKCAFFSSCSEQLNWLLENGYIESSAASAKAMASSAPLVGAPFLGRETSARDALIALGNELLGSHADAVVRRLQETPETLDALQTTVARCHKLIRLSIDEKKAALFLQQGTAILAST